MLDPQGRGRRLILDRLYDRRWWCYSFIPPTPEHPRTRGHRCDSGVALFRLDDGVRTHLLAGHNGSVYALAPSPDGKWLVTGSSDQTVRLWRLPGMDVLAPLGARFAAGAAGGAVAADVAHGGFAEAMGLEKGDRIEALYINSVGAADLTKLDSLPPNTKIELLVVRNGSTGAADDDQARRPGPDPLPGPRPRVGALDTARLLRDLDARRPEIPRLAPEPAQGNSHDYFSFDHFEKELRRPDALLRFWQTADRDALAAALAPAPVPAPVAVPVPSPIAANEPAPVVAANPLPIVQIIAPPRPAFDPLVVPFGPLAVRVRAATEEAAAGRGLIRAVRVLVDSRKAEDIAVAPPLAEVERPVALNLDPGRHTISVTAVNDRDQERTTRFDVIAKPPLPPAPDAEPVLAAWEQQVRRWRSAFDQFIDRDPTYPRIPYARRGYPGRGRVPRRPRSARPGSRMSWQVQTLLGPEVTATRIDQELQVLDEETPGGTGNSGRVIRSSVIIPEVARPGPREEGPRRDPRRRIPATGRLRRAPCQPIESPRCSVRSPSTAAK